jgi:LmbE family N-acetylglucosaminyl deacetylase
MSTLVSFHAHPDDEAIATGGSLARASAEGHRVVLVIATHGEWGEVPDALAPGETLVHRREAETAESARILGIHRVAWLGYEDSGMTGWEQNSNPGSFHQAPVDEAAERLAAILREEQADILTVYDWHGNYGHPDHIKVHHVGHRAAELAGTERVAEATLNRTAVRRMVEMAREQGLQLSQEDDDFDIDGPADDGNPMGTEEHEITLAIDVSPFVWLKREAVKAHRSQVTDTSFFAEMPDEMFSTSFGTEWFIERGVEQEGGPRRGWFFE